MRAALRGVWIWGCLSLVGCEPNKPTPTPASASPEPTATASMLIDREAARVMLRSFLEPGADTKALSRELIPRPEDYAAVFEAGAAERVRAAYQGPFDKGMLHVHPKPGQSELAVFSATPSELAAQTGEAVDFPPGYQRIAGHYRPTITIYRFSFSAPGAGLGMSYDGLVHVNGHWVMIPKPWRVLR